MARILIILGLAGFIQGYFFSAATSSQVIPNLVLTLLLIYVWQASLKQALLAGLWAGFWLDVASYSHFGLRTLWFMAAAALALLIKNTGLDLNKFWIVLTVVSGFGLLYNLTLLTAAMITAGSWLSPWPYAGRWFLELMINAVFVWWFLPRVKLLIGRKSNGLI